MVFIYCKLIIKIDNQNLVIDGMIDKVVNILMYFYKLLKKESKYILDRLIEHIDLNYSSESILYKINLDEISNINKLYLDFECSQNKVIFLQIYSNDFNNNLVIDRHIKHMIKDSNEYKVPMLIDVSYKVKKFSYDYIHLFNQYKKNIYLKKNLKMNKNNNYSNKIEIYIKDNLNKIELNIFKHISDKFRFNIVSPSKIKVKNIDKSLVCDIENANILFDLKNENNINIKIQSNSFLEKGKWKVILEPLNICKGNVDIYSKIEANDLDKLRLEDEEITFLIFNGIKLEKKYRYSRELQNLELDLSNLIPIFIVDYKDGFEEDIKTLKSIYEFRKLGPKFGILYVYKNELKNIGELYRIKSISRIQRYAKMVQLAELIPGTTDGYVANEDIGANFFKTNPNIDIDGSGVLISIANSGIDYLHPDFIYPDGTSKILYLWDQTKEGKPPEGFKIGTEYTREDINKAIKENNPDLSVDEEGIGTALSGICTGLGNGEREYAGVAEGSELIVIKLKKIDGYYNSATLHIAMRYAYQKAKENNMPLINQVSLGSNEAIVTGTLIIPDDLFYEYGICEVVAAGNEGSGKSHTTGKIEFKGDIKDVEVELQENEKNLEIDLWMNKPDTANVSIISPSGEESKSTFVSNFNFIDGLFDLENTYYNMICSYPSPYSGYQQININLDNIKKGIWKIRLKGEDITNGIYQIYLPNRKLLKEGTKFREGNPNYTITYPGGYKDTITVGVYDSINNSIWAKSSRGPSIGTIGRVTKPDLIAPGVNIIAPYTKGRYATVTGSSVSAAFVTGAVALIMQYSLVDKNYKNKAIVQKIATYLKAGAKRNETLQYPNANYGYGVLDIEGIFEQLK
ncbi:S8 family serine peptidase [Paraclostridium bifermentans]|uniref:S8 family serine peptidase n=1 Tax=Paraclostridium bifermentans TaxID=1490 RepID=UPI00359C236D